MTGDRCQSTIRNRSRRPRGLALLGALPGVLLGALLGLLVGCLDGGNGGTGPGASVTGKWSFSTGECEQFLAFDGKGGFRLAILTAVPGQVVREGVDGRYTVEEGGSGGRVTLRLAADAEPKPHALAYCDQWARRTTTGESFAASWVAAGFDPSDYTFRSVVAPGLGKVLIGTDGQREDRIAVFHDAGAIQGAVFDDPVRVPVPLYRALPDDVTLAPDLGTPTAQLNLPTGLYRKDFDIPAGAPFASPIDQVILNIVGATEIAVSVESPGSSVPRCHVTVFEDIVYSSPVSPPILDPTAPSQTLRLNPLDPAQFFVVELVSAPGGDLPAYLWPLAIFGDLPGDCRVTVRGTALAAVVLDEIVSRPGFEPAIYQPVAGDTLSVYGFAFGHREAQRRFAFEPGVLSRGLSGLPERAVSFPPLVRDESDAPPFFDALRLLEDGFSLHDVPVGHSGGEAFLSIFAADDPGTGFGPFQAYPGAEPEATLTVPAAAGGHLEGGGDFVIYRFDVAVPERIAFWSDGGVDTAALLFDETGRLIAGDDNSAPDGIGFLIARTLAAGGYDLRIAASGAGGDFDLFAQPTASAAFADEALDACLLAAGIDQLPPNTLTELVCVAQGVRDLSGIAAAGPLERLELAENEISDLAPLAGLTELQLLSLAGNRVSDLAPLAGLDQLRTLGLGFNALTLEDLAVLASLRNTLTVIDLSGVVTLSESEAAALKALLPATVIVTPKGNVLR